MNRPQDWQRDRVVATNTCGLGVMAQDVVVERLDDVDRLQQVETIERDIANIGYLKRIERRRTGRHAIRPHHDGFVTDLSRTETRACAVARANIETDTGDCNIQPFGTFCSGQSKHRSRPGIARHLVAAQWLIKVAHDSSLARYCFGVCPVSR